MNTHSTYRRLLSLALAATTAVCATLATAHAEIEPDASALVKTVSAKLSAAQTIRLTAKHTMSPALSVASKLDKGPLKITVQRPNKCYVLQPAGDETRELIFDGRALCLMQPTLKIHAIGSVRANSIEEFADQMDAHFGFRPPVAELLSKDLAGQLFLNVTSAKVTGSEWVGWTRCDRLHFEQPGMTGDLWVGKKDKLPHRYLLTFTDLSGQPTWDIRLTKWELNVPVDASLFSKRPAADSQKVQLLKSR
jgi:hypothetical protein